jgi:hypothetical protein
LEDGSEEGSTYGPGNVQNWGSIPKVVRDTVLVPMGEHPGVACRGFASQG